MNPTPYQTLAVLAALAVLDRKPRKNKDFARPPSNSRPPRPPNGKTAKNAKDANQINAWRSY